LETEVSVNDTHAALPRLRRLDLFMIAMLVLIPFLIPGYWVFTNAGLFGADLPDFHLPHQEFIHDNMIVGDIPFWNPYSYGGGPEFGNPEMAPMYPPVLIGQMLLGAEQMLRLKYILHIALAGVGIYLLLRVLHIAPLLALLGALNLESSGFVITKIVLPNVGDSAAWIGWILFFNYRFARRTSLGDGLFYGLAGGMALLLFFPQITLTLFLLAALFGVARHVHFSTRRLPERGTVAWWIDRVALPIVELGVLVLALRYPAKVVRFPQEGWRCALNGLGASGLVFLALIPVGWIAWVALRRGRLTFNVRTFVRWAIGFAFVWVLAAEFAAPQLAVTGELIGQSNQTALDYQDKDFFTGAQAYGTLQDFVIQTALARPKEPVNNMAIGPFVYLLAAAGMLAGFHRRHRVFFLMTICAALTLLYYMAAPGVFDVARRLPFFDKFAGLSRYLAFLNVFLLVLAALSAQLWVRRFMGFRRGLVYSIVLLMLVANLALLLRHQARFWDKMRSEPSAADYSMLAKSLPPLSPGERILVDARDRGDYPALLMFGLANRIESIAGYGPIRSSRYDDFLAAHNRSLGVDHSEYRAPLFEPTPSDWTRALRTRLFLYPPGSEPGAGSDRSTTGTFVRTGDWKGWQAYADTREMPEGWLVANLSSALVIPESRSGEPPTVEMLERELHRRTFEVRNATDRAAWLVISMASYPGWVATVDGHPAVTDVAAGYLKAVSVPKGVHRVRLEYRPASFSWGWICSLWAIWAWIVMYAWSRLRRPELLSEQGWRGARVHLFLAILGGPIAYAFASRVFEAPDLLLARILEAGMIGLVATLLAAVADTVLHEEHIANTGEAASDNE
jgi:hypothetical protein